MRALYYVLTMTLLAGSLACSHGAIVVSPDTTTDRGSTASGPHLWGLFDVSINPDTLEVSVTPARTAEVRIDVNQFMNMNPASLGLQITDSSNLFLTGELTLNVTINHPINKPKLAGFDVHCVFLSDGTNWLNYDTDLVYPLEGTNPILMNPDGWTRWYNAVEFKTPGIFGYVPGAKGNIPKPQATLNGYKLYADGLAATADVASWLTANQTNKAMFSPGASNVRELKLKFPIVGGKPLLKFQYAVVASWAMPSDPDPGPEDFPPEANIQEASMVRVDTSDSTMFYTPTEQGGDIVLHVDVFDWQGGTDIDAQVSIIIVESDVLSAPYIDPAPVLNQTTGNPFATWDATIPADNLSASGETQVWVIVESADPTNYMNIPTATYPEAAKLAAFNRVPATVSDVAPAGPPEILSGVDIASGTTLCPDRAADNNAVFEVVAQADLPITYKWTIVEGKTSTTVPGFDEVPGDGAGHLTVDFTGSTFESLTELLLISCTVDDGVHPPVGAESLTAYLDCILFNANLNSPAGIDNVGWKMVDIGGNTHWFPVGAQDKGTNLVGTGALWQNPAGGVDANSKGMLISFPVFIPTFLSSAHVEVTHSYSFEPFTMGANIKVGALGTITTVASAFSPIASGHGYDGTLTDNTNAMYPQQVFSASGLSGSYVSIVNVPGALIGQSIVVGLAAASGNNAYADGGWLIDDVKIIGTL